MGYICVPPCGHLIAASKNSNGSEHCKDVVDRHGATCTILRLIFDLSMPQGLSHIHMTALLRCVQCAACSEHMVAFRTCMDIVADIIHSGLIAPCPCDLAVGLLQDVKI